MKTNPNDPAHPTPYTNQDGTIQYDVYLGLTKREYFTALAIQGLCANVESASIADIALSAVKIADALIEALNKED